LSKRTTTAPYKIESYYAEDGMWRVCSYELSQRMARMAVRAAYAWDGRPVRAIWNPNKPGNQTGVVYEQPVIKGEGK
jgi:hypothetical protein